MGLLIFLLVLVLIVMFVFKGSYEGGASFVKANKQERKGEIKYHANADFESFVGAWGKAPRLICVVGPDLSGRTHLAKMIAAKFGHKYIDEHKANGKRRKMPDIRKEYYNEEINSTRGKAARDAIKKKAQKFVISGNFSDEDLKKLFKGDPLNKNFTLIAIMPEDSGRSRWTKATAATLAASKPKSKNPDAAAAATRDFDSLKAEAKKIIETLGKKYIVNVVKNKF